ncbi:hypothetical protein BJX70DRAFT_313132 [Aspergillus crustosus]
MRHLVTSGLQLIEHIRHLTRCLSLIQTAQGFFVLRILGPLTSTVDKWLVRISCQTVAMTATAELWDFGCYCPAVFGLAGLALSVWLILQLAIVGDLGVLYFLCQEVTEKSTVIIQHPRMLESWGARTWITNLNSGRPSTRLDVMDDNWSKCTVTGKKRLLI